VALRSLNLSSNSLKHFPEILGRLEVLELDLSSNHLTYLPNTINDVSLTCTSHRHD
jgi:Leucine-rich repeat (LRR) protein